MGIRAVRPMALESTLLGRLSPNSALLTDAFSSLRCAFGAAKRGR
jgi:hypothetical protein